MTIDVARARKRLIAMGIINLVAVAAAVASLVGYLRLGVGWGIYAFGAAMLAGFAAQIWFIVGLRASRGGA